MYAGRFVETGPIGRRDHRPCPPLHRRTACAPWSFAGARQRARADRRRTARSRRPAPGCSFAPRCKLVRPECSEHVPELVVPSNDRAARCVLVTPGKLSSHRCPDRRNVALMTTELFIPVPRSRRIATYAQVRRLSHRCLRCDRARRRGSKRAICWSDAAGARAKARGAGRRSGLADGAAPCTAFPTA
jgi:hypothetical protein